MRMHNFYRPAPRTTIVDNSININSTTVNNGTGLSLGSSCYGYGFGGWNWGGCSCGCSGGGFWGGFRNGLGTVLGGFLGGFGMNALFGGLGMGGMMSPWGMSSWGMTSPWSLWGGRGGSAAGATDSSSKTKDKDQAKLSDLIKDVKAFTKNPTEAEAKRLYNIIEPLTKEPIDDKNKDNNIDHYQRLLGDVTKKAAEKGWNLTDDKDKVDGGKDKVDGGKDKVDGDKDKVDGDKDKVDGDKDKVDGGKVDGDKDDKTTQPKKVEDLEKISAEDKELLKKLGVELIKLKPESIYGDKMSLTLPKNVKDLTKKNLEAIARVAKDNNIGVAVAHNDRAGRDKWIAGTISGIEEKDGKLNFKIECNINNENYGLHGYTYSVKQGDDSKYTVTCESSVDAGYKATPRTYTFSNGQLYRSAPGEEVIKKQK